MDHLSYLENAPLQRNTQEIRDYIRDEKLMKIKEREG